MNVDTLFGDFHFMRPIWLLALLPCALLLHWLWRQHANQGNWSRIIDPALLGALLLPQAAATRSRWPLLLLFAWLLAVLGLAGPAWERMPEPVHRSDDALIIALDLGPSMRAADVSPSRLERARFKLADVLASRTDGSTALIAYAGDAHVVSPLSDDRRTLEAMLPALSPEIMPAQGNNLPAAVTLAGELLRGAGLSRGRLLVISDSFAAAQHDEVCSRLARNGLQLSLLAVGTAQGAPVQLADGGFLRNASGGIVVPSVDHATMARGARRCDGRFSPLSLDARDLDAVLPDAHSGAAVREQDRLRRFDAWRDRGALLALLLLPLAALAFRRGWLLGLPLLLVLQPATPAQALEWNDLWQRRDQQAAQALAQQDPARAAQLFDSPAWRGMAQYQSGDYESAARSFGELDEASAHYNRGNALARAGKLQEALAAYDAALERQPGMSDAESNRELVQELLSQQPPPQQSGEDGDSSPEPGDEQQKPDADSSGSDTGESPQAGDQSGDDSKEESGAPEPGEEQPPQPGEPSQHAGADDAQPERQPAAGAGPRADEAETGDPAAAASADDDVTPNEQEQAIEQWLRQVPDDPGQLLRRKFEYEYRARNAQSRRQQEEQR
jgi:Ca-activated chloride channel homolog